MAGFALKISLQKNMWFSWGSILMDIEINFKTNTIFQKKHDYGENSIYDLCKFLEW